MAKKKNKNLVCNNKGNSRYNDTFQRFVKTPCECKKPLQRNLSKKDTLKLSYYMSKREDGVCFRQNPQGSDGSKSHTAVPCRELFAKRNSTGLRLIERWTGEVSFPGCQAVEEMLREELLVNNEHSTNFRVLSGSDMPEYKARSPLHDPHSNWLPMTNIDEIYAEYSVWDQIRNEPPYPEPTRNRKNHLFTDLRYHSELLRFLKTIPSSQRKPIRMYFMKNTKGLTMRAVAQKLECSVSTLHDRLKKLETGFREFLGKRQNKVILRKKADVKQEE